MTVAAAPTDILDVADRLVSPFTGIVRKLHRVYKDVSEPAAPFIWRAEISNHRFLPDGKDRIVIGAGKGFDPDSAKRSALGEAVERYCGLRPPPSDCRVCPRDQLEGLVLEPELLVLHSDEQLRTLSYARYERDLPIAWINGARLPDETPAWIPAQAAYLVPPFDTPVLFQATSNGLAAGGDTRSARLAAVLEIVERDAFLCAWYHRLPAQRVDAETHPDKRVTAVLDAYRRRGVALEVYRLPNDHQVPVVAALAIGKDADDPAIVVGLGAARRLSDAVRSAVSEVGQVRPAIRINLRDPKTRERRDELVADPQRVTELEDHDLLYTDPRMLFAFDMWRGQSGEWASIGEEEPASDDDLEWVVQRLIEVGAHTYVCDMTTSDIAMLGLHVARAIIEDFQPIHFGEAEFRKGGHRFWDIPHRLGLEKDERPPRSLNPLPHPLS